MTWNFVDDYNDVVEATRAFNEGIKQGEESEEMQTLLSYFRAWYYIPELDAVGPSKFIGYKGMTVPDYMSSEDLDGRDSEVILRKWFTRLENSSREARYVEDKVNALLGRHGKSPNRIARFNAPKNWSLDDSATAAPRRTPQQHAMHDVGRPIVEVFWRAFLSLYPEDQEAIAERILEYRG